MAAPSSSFSPSLARSLSRPNRGTRPTYQHRTMRTALRCASVANLHSFLVTNKGSTHAPTNQKPRPTRSPFQRRDVKTTYAAAYALLVASLPDIPATRVKESDKKAKGGRDKKN